MASSTGIKKVGSEHREKISPASNEEHAKFTAPSSRRSAVATWFKSMMMCSLPSPPRRLFHSQPRHKTSDHQDEPPNQVNVEVQICTANAYSTSQHSVSKNAINKSLVAAPSEYRNNKSVKGSIEPFTLELYEVMPHNDSVRLLRIHAGTPTDPVEATLEFARLDHSTPEFEALSYAWGPNILASHIIHRPNRQIIPITSNLYEALQGVRRYDGDRLLWVDALCINQGDRKEKGTQVRKMNVIYAHASCVLVWLSSDHAGDAYDAFGVLCALADEAFKQKMHVDSYGAQKAQYATGMLQKEHVVFDAVPHVREEHLWRKVMQFFGQTWYLRLWVLQEIVLAREATLVWGDCSISWRYVGAAIETIRKKELLQMILDTRSLQNAFIMWRLSTVHRNSQSLLSGDGSQTSNQRCVYPLLHLLDLGRSFQVTDPRDKVYGLLGFPTNDDGFTASIMPDYALSTDEVYTQVTRSIIENDQNLDILALAMYIAPPRQQPKFHVDNLPSWVPNFNCQITPFTISNMNAGQEYSTGLARPLCLLPSPTRTTLRLKGAHLDTIRATGPRTEYQELHAIRPQFRALLTWAQDAGIPLGKIAATLTAGRNSAGNLLRPAHKSAYLANLTRLLECYVHTDAWPVFGNRADMSTHVAYEAEEALWRFLMYRRPFVTTTGEFGLGPWETEDGDAVVVLWGAQTPLVVSAVGDAQWMLKGECFVEVWMAAEAVQAVAGEEDCVFDIV